MSRPKSLKIRKITSGAKLWKIPGEIAEEYGLKDGSTVTLNCGSLSSQVRVTTDADESIGLSEDVLIELSIPEESRMGIKQDSIENFRLGPVVGILTFLHVMKNGDFSGYVPYALKMNDIGLLYVFGPRSIDSDSRTISGYTYSKAQNFWHERAFPFPDVVMDRIYPNLPKTHKELETVMGPNKIFNKHTLINKINFYKSLQTDSILKNYIPDTKRLSNLPSLEYMLDKYPEIFIKPVNGMKGKEIYLLSKTNGNIMCKYLGRNSCETQIFHGSEEFLDLLASKSKRKRQYILQAAISRMKYKSQPFDFRVMAVKNGSGHWATPAIFTKLAEPGGFITNISSRGQYLSLSTLMEDIESKLPYNQKHLVTLLSNLSTRTASILDKNFGPLGKLGIDIAIDVFGKPWLIEANGNPGLMPKAALIEYPFWKSQMYDYPLAYCLYLSGFNHLNTALPM